MAPRSFYTAKSSEHKSHLVAPGPETRVLTLLVWSEGAARRVVCLCGGSPWCHGSCWLSFQFFECRTLSGKRDANGRPFTSRQPGSHQAWPQNAENREAPTLMGALSVRIGGGRPRGRYLHALVSAIFSHHLTLRTFARRSHEVAVPNTHPRAQSPQLSGPTKIHWHTRKDTATSTPATQRTAPRSQFLSAKNGWWSTSCKTVHRLD